MFHIICVFVESEIEITSKTTSSTQDRKGSNIYDEKLISHEKQEYAGNTVDTEDKSKRANNPCYSNMFNRELTELESPK